MKALILLFCSFFLLTNTNNEKSDENKEFYYEKVENMNELKETIDEDSSIKLEVKYRIEEEKTIVTFLGNNLPIYSFEENKNITYLSKKYVYYQQKIFYYELVHSKLIQKTISIDGSIEEEIVLNNLNWNDFFVSLNEDTIYLFGECIKNEENHEIEIVQIGESINAKTYQGKGKEKVIDAVFYEDDLYLLIQKYQICEGDFGNGGKANSEEAKILVKINNNLEIEKIVYFEETQFLKIERLENRIVITFSNSIYVFDSSLNQIKGLKFNTESIYTKSTINELGIIYVARFLKNGYEVIDLNSYTKISENAYLNELNEYLYFDKIMTMNHSFYGIVQNKIEGIFNILLIDGFVNKQIYHNQNNKPNYMNKNITTFFHDVACTKVQTLGNFDELKCGEYRTYYFYQDTLFCYELIGLTSVIPAINIRDGLIYPSGTCIESNLEMTLNDKKIESGEILTEEGKYVLKEFLENGTLYETISFEIRNSKNKAMRIGNDSYYQDSFAYYLNLFESLDLEYKIELSYEELTKKEIKLIVNEKPFYQYELKKINEGETILSMWFTPLDIGINYYDIMGIQLEDEFIEIKDSITIIGLNQELEYEEEYTINNEKISLDVNISDVDNTLRNWYIDYYDGTNRIKREQYLLEDQKITLDRIEKAKTIKIGFISDCLYKNVMECELVQLNYKSMNKNNEIELKILNQEESIHELLIQISKNNSLEKVYINKNEETKTIYQSVSYPYLIILLICLFLIINSISISLWIYLRSKKQNEELLKINK